jgi:hypothetical protein
VFAKRMGVTKDGIERIIQSEDQMEDNIFRHINRQELVKYRELVIFENIQFLSNYFKD